MGYSGERKIGSVQPEMITSIQVQLVQISTCPVTGSEINDNAGFFSVCTRDNKCPELDNAISVLEKQGYRYRTQDVAFDRHEIVENQ